MLGEIVKKQFLLLFRNPVQILLLVGLPIILIAILSTALKGMMTGEPPGIKVKIAMVEHGSEEEDIDRFLAEAEKEGMPDEVREGMDSVVGRTAPVQMLSSIFESEELGEMVEFELADADEMNEIREDNSYTALIEVPEGFTYETLKAIILGHGTQPILTVNQNDDHQVGTAIVNGLLKQYQEQLTLGTFLEKQGIDYNKIKVDMESMEGEIAAVDQKNPTNVQSYYTVGMAVMNVLYIASTIGSIAFMEKKIHVFDRIIIGNISRWTYFTGVFISSTILSFIQLLIIYGFSWLVFGVYWPNILGFLAVSMAFAIAVGGIAVLLTAISYRINGEVITNFFSGIIVTLLSVLGGSFFPIGDVLPFIRTIGNLTPNGAGLSAYLGILRGDGFSDVSQHLLYMLLFAFVCICIAAISFPKRGAA